MSYSGYIQAGLGGRLLLLTLALLLSACGTQSYKGTRVADAHFLERGMTQREGDITVTAAVPDAAETAALVGLDLYDQGIQPVWLKIENNSPTRARVALWSIDRDYFSPIEVAYMNKKKFSGQGYDDMQRWFYENALPRFTEPGESTSGLVFTHLRPGTKGFNLSIFANRTAHDFTFFVPLPGFIADFMEVDFANLYAADQIVDLDRKQLRQVLEKDLGCCVTDPTGKEPGGPFNAVLVGTGPAVRRAMLRGGWLETSSDDEIQLKARFQHFDGRPPDAIFTQLREDGNERIQLHFWMTRWRFNGKPLWATSVFYFTVEKAGFGMFDIDYDDWNPELRALFVNESVSSDLDSAQKFLLQNLWYNGSLQAMGYVRGMEQISMEEPRVTFGGIPYFTDGLRLVAFLSEEPVALDETRFLFESSERSLPEDQQ